MRTATDARRSLARYVAEILDEGFPADWDVQSATESGSFQRPGATVLDASPGDASGSVRVVEKIASYVVNVFPPLAESAYEGQLAAERIADAIETAFCGGRGLGRAWLIPLYDYDGVSDTDTTDARTDVDFLKVRDLSTRAVQSPSDELAWTVNCEVRLGWRRNALLPSSERTTRDVLVNQTGS